MFGLKTDEILGIWRIYTSPNILKLTNQGGLDRQGI
jgi:hypothetical protein